MQCRLHELRHKRRISVAAASKILANLVYSYKGMGLSMGTMCAGVTPQEGPALYYIDSDGTRLAGNLFCVGSGQTFAYGVLDAEYHYELGDEEALELGRRSILAATHRDAYSGGFINLYHVKEEGWTKHGFSVSLFETNYVNGRLHFVGHEPDLLEDQAREGGVLERQLYPGLTDKHLTHLAVRRRHGAADLACNFSPICYTRFRQAAECTCTITLLFSQSMYLRCPIKQTTNPLPHNTPATVLQPLLPAKSASAKTRPNTSGTPLSRFHTACYPV